MTSIQELVLSAESGATIVLSEELFGSTDTPIVESLTVPRGKTLTIDLAGHTWQGAPGFVTLFVSGANVTLRNGTLYQQSQITLQIGEPDASFDSFVTLESTLKVRNKDSCAILLAKRASLVTSADIIADSAFCISGNGTAPYFGSHASIEGGTISVEPSTWDGPAIYWPQGDSSLVVKKGTISGPTGIEIRAGKLTVNGGTIRGTGKFSVTPNGNGSTTIGAGVAVAQHTTRLRTEARIAGGTIEGEVALCEANPQNNPSTATSKIFLRITGGTFKGADGGSAVVSADCKGFITGGSFTHIDNALVDPSAKFVNEGGVVVIKPATMSGTPMFIADVIADGALTSTSQGRAMGVVNELPSGDDAIEGTVVLLSTDERYYRYNGEAWEEFIPAISTGTIDDSERPVQSGAVKDALDAIGIRLDDVYTKAEADRLLAAKQAAVTGAASTIVSANLPAGRVLVSDANGKVMQSEVTVNQLATLEGLESTVPLQTQIDGLKGDLDSKLSKTVYDTDKKAADASIAAVDKKADANAKALEGKQDKLVAGDNITIVGTTVSAVIPDAAKPESALSDTSENAVQNKVIKKAIDAVDAKFTSYYTKSEATDILKGYLPVGGTAAKAVADEDGNSIKSKYALKSELTSATRLMGTCTSAELDAKEKVSGHIWYLKDSREYNGETYVAGTAWICMPDDKGALTWMPMGAGTEIDLSGYQPKDLVLSNVSPVWTNDSGIEDFPYKGTIAQTGITAADVATVVFATADAASGVYAPTCDTDTEKVIVYAKTGDAVVIPTVTIRKG